VIRLASNIQKLSADENGQTTIEWVLLLTVFVLPMVWVLNMLLAVLVEHYRMVTFFETLPFP
jgi:Flp pilus assembly pilin Flp